MGRKWQRDLRLSWEGEGEGEAQTQILPSACQARPRLILSVLRSGYNYPHITGEDTEAREVNMPRWPAGRGEAA